MEIVSFPAVATIFFLAFCGAGVLAGFNSGFGFPNAVVLLVLYLLVSAFSLTALAM